MFKKFLLPCLLFCCTYAAQPGTSLASHYVWQGRLMSTSEGKLICNVDNCNEKLTLHAFCYHLHTKHNILRIICPIGNCPVKRQNKGCVFTTGASLKGHLSKDHESFVSTLGRERQTRSKAKKLSTSHQQPQIKKEEDTAPYQSPGIKIKQEEDVYEQSSSEMPLEQQPVLNQTIINSAAFNTAAKQLKDKWKKNTPSLIAQQQQLIALHNHLLKLCTRS